MDREKSLTFGDWMVTILVLAIPLVNVVALIYWAASSGTNVSKQDYARASIAWSLIGLAVFLVLSLTGALVGLTGTNGTLRN